MSAGGDEISVTSAKSVSPSEKSDVASEERSIGDASSAPRVKPGEPLQKDERYMMSGALRSTSPVGSPGREDSSEPDPDRPIQSTEKPPRAPSPSQSELNRTPTDSEEEDPQSPGTGLDDKYLTGKRKKRKPRSNSGSSNGAAPAAKRQEQASSGEEL